MVVRPAWEQTIGFKSGIVWVMMHKQQKPGTVLGSTK